VWVVAAGLVAGACSGDEPAAVDNSLARYATALSDLTNEYRTAIGDLSAPEGADAGDLLGGAAVSMWSYISVVSALEPPADLADEHQAYVDAFIASATYMNDATAALEGVTVEDMPDVIAAEFGTTAATLGASVAAACTDLQQEIAVAGIGVQLGCEG
jgi:hypothetical protein